MRKEIEKLLSSGLTAYQIAKYIGVQPVQIQRYMNGETSIGNMTLDRAEQLYKLYLELKEKGEIEND
ncbi:MULTISPECIES: helix-turn-helix domain-containing protein [unclassified Facklamia]|uniref:helix-turn-helix domain-containing protein n=1 Tax=Aerococcaceae TaxID=186827 RepID=UPI0013B9BD70|nr:MULTISPECIES: helix-turn-helix domain-containing protein [unclassified Facklamia]NEW65316.1 helix-turn-helix domain-containing protein [Facklamia sp. 252]NEW68336.1 helix-turn-helix domain-containing protein [Facklamia sp. 253]QQD66156.1 helix-turn-helix transcriptional regulator [Aerococcaceae bacterium zg-252]